MSADDARLACLAGLKEMGRARLSAMLAHHTPEEAMEVVRGERPASGPIAHLLVGNQKVRDEWRAGAARRPEAWYSEALERSETRVLRPADPDYPPQLCPDPERPELLFVRGDMSCLRQRRVGVVGTRNATHQGRLAARRIGRELADEGVVVVSGLALGVDGAAHEGALSSAGGHPVAVVGSGPDVPYPKRHRGLWDLVIERGVLISEWPPGTPPDAFRFPKRNRILAALSEALVVVESRKRGGSLITAVQAAERGIEVFAVPGALDSPASAGTIGLIADGASIFTGTADVLTWLGIDTGRVCDARVDPRPRPTGLGVRVFDECRAGAVTVDRVALGLDIGVADAAMALARLERDGWVRHVAGWFEVTGEGAAG